jgi:hypothetical protein
MIALTAKFATAKKMVLVAALVAGGIVAADDFAMGRSPAPAEIGKQMDRHPDLRGSVLPRVTEIGHVAGERNLGFAAAKKSDRLVADAGIGCAEQTWPNIGLECLTKVGAVSKKSIRTVTVERQTSSNGSTLERVSKW